MSNTRAFLIWLSITIFYCYQYIIRLMPNSIMPNLIDNFAITAADFGSFAGIYYIGYILVHIPFGIALARFGGRYVLPASIIMVSLSILPVTYSDSWFLVVFGRLVSGIGSSASIVCALQMFRILYPNSHTTMLGLMVSVSLIIAVFGGKELSVLISHFGLSYIVDVIAVIGVILALFTFLIMPNTEKQQSEDIMQDFLNIIQNKRIIILSILGGMMIGPLEGFADAWGSAFFVTVYGLSASVADSNVLAILLGTCFGCLAVPYIADHYRAHYSLTILSGIIMTICFAAFLYWQINIDLLYYLCFIIGIFCSYQVLIVSIISDFVEPNKSGMAASVTNMIVMTFGWVFHNSIGYLMTSQQDQLGITQQQIYINSISVIPIAMFVAVLGVTMFVARARVQVMVRS